MSNFNELNENELVNVSGGAGEQAFVYVIKSGDCLSVIAEKYGTTVKKLCELPGDYEVYPGHMDSTTLQRERSFNYYCRAAMSM